MSPCYWITVSANIVKDSPHNNVMLYEVHCSNSEQCKFIQNTQIQLQIKSLVSHIEMNHSQLKHGHPQCRINTHYLRAVHV